MILLLEKSWKTDIHHKLTPLKEMDDSRHVQVPKRQLEVKECSHWLRVYILIVVVKYRVDQAQQASLKNKKHKYYRLLLLEMSQRTY